MSKELFNSKSLFHKSGLLFGIDVTNYGKAGLK